MGEESTEERIFTLGEMQYYLAVCYDIFGVKHKPSKELEVDAVLNLIHEFTRKGRGSGISYFTRLGLGGASNEWNCPVYASSFFIDRSVPSEWPMGVRYEGKNAIEARYDDLRIEEKGSFQKDIEEGKALIKIHNFSKKKCS